MKTKSAILGTLVITIALILLIIGKQGFCHDAGNPYSGEGTGNIGAWYDETWQASGFYRLQQITGTDDFRYEYITDPLTNTASQPLFGTNGPNVRDGTAVPGSTAAEVAHFHGYTDITDTGDEEAKTTATAGGHNHSYTDATSGASLPQDIVVTEWRATGHVHFTHE